MSGPTYPILQLPFLPPNIIVPVEGLDFTFVQFLMRMYEEIAFNINARDYTFYTIPISDVAQDIPNIPNFGAFIVCVSGVDSTQPVKTWSLVKSTSTNAGVINVLGTQAGTAVWAGINLTITSTANNFQISHNLASVTGSFNIRIIGTQ
jgi:hypothetical protein